LLGGLLVTIDLAHTGWRSVFFVNVPGGLAIAFAAWRIMPSVPRRAGTRLDIKGSVVLFAGLLRLIGPLLFGHDVGWAPWLWAVMLGGGAILAGFLKLEHAVARADMPLIDLTLLADAARSPPASPSSRSRSLSSSPRATAARAQSIAAPKC
jgi:hypothetical protein